MAFRWLTLIEKAAGRAVRVTPKAEVMQANRQTEFFQDYRMKGIPASEVPAAVIAPLVERVMIAPDDQLFDIGEVFERHREEPPHSFDGFVCESYGEMTV